MRLFSSRIGLLRAAGIGLCAVVAVAGLAAIVLDKEEEPFESGDRLPPSFSAGYECADARNQLSADELAYRLGYESGRWVARVEVSVARADDRGPCSLRLGVPPGSYDAGSGGATVSLGREGSSSSGVVTIPVGGRGDDYVMEVVLPRDYEMFHSLGLGQYFFKFDFFAPGEGGSFKQGSLEIRLPEGYSVVEALPRGGREPSERTRVWSLKADRDQRAAVTFRHDRLRQAVDLAPEVAFGAVLILVLLSLPQRREEPVEAEPGAEPVLEPVTASAAAPSPAPEPSPALTGPPAVERELAPAPGPPSVAEPEPQPQLSALPAPRPPAPSAPPAVSPPERRAARARAIGLTLVAAAVVLRLVRRRGSGR